MHGFRAHAVEEQFCGFAPELECQNARVGLHAIRAIRIANENAKESTALQRDFKICGGCWRSSAGTVFGSFPTFRKRFKAARKRLAGSVVDDKTASAVTVIAPFFLCLNSGKTGTLLWSGWLRRPRERLQVFVSGAKPFRVMAPQLFFLRRNSHQPMTRQILLSWR